MTDSPTKLTTPFDFDAPGKHCDFIRLPHSVHRAAYGWLPLPIVCIKNGDGPTVLVMAGTHGDEYEGQVAISRLAQSLETEAIAGRLILFLLQKNYLKRIFPRSKLTNSSEDEAILR